MENVSTQPLALQHIVASDAFERDPFALVDIGCALGIDPTWRLFDPHLVAWGFDPQIEECARLNAAELNPNIQYHPAFVGLDADHPFHTQRPAADGATRDYFNPLARTSAYRAADWNPGVAHEAPEAVEATDHWQEQNLADEKIALSEFLAREGIRSVDLVKIDTDGSDLEAAVSCETAVRPSGILGFLIESPFVGTHEPGENTFHNIDRYMKEQGFVLFGMTVNTYSRAALPRTFVYKAPYQTRGGQPIWGDMLYLRDAASAQYEAVWGPPGLTVAKLLKLVCLFELFDLPDCAVEVLLVHRSSLAAAVDPDELLDLLTPPLRSKQLSYAEYNAAFDDDIELFYPGDEPPPATAGAVPAQTGRRGLSRAFLRRLARRPFLR